MRSEKYHSVPSAPRKIANSMPPGSLYLLQTSTATPWEAPLRGNKRYIRPSIDRTWRIISSIYFAARGGRERLVSRAAFAFHRDYLVRLRARGDGRKGQRFRSLDTDSLLRSFQLIGLWCYINFMNNFNADVRWAISLPLFLGAHLWCPLTVIPVEMRFKFIYIFAAL